MSLEYEIRSALQKVEAGAVKERASGLSTLKLLLSDHSNTGEVSESLWGVVLETIARLVEKQKATYLTKLAGTGRGSSKAPLEKLAKALTEIGQDFRWLCERGKSSLKLALVKIVLNHILTVLPFKDGIFPPLATPYARALRLVLTVPSYRDHIPASAWDAIFQLCIRGLRPGNNTSSSPLDVDNDFLESSLEFTAVSSGHSKTSAVELDFARTLTSLVTSTPVDIRGHAKQLFDFLAHFFQSYTQDTHCHIPLLCTANHLLSETSLADLDEMALFLRTAIPQLLPFWENRANQNLRIQLLHSFRVALATSTTDRDEAHELSMQIADHIYDCIPRDVRSKFGFNVLPSARQAMSAVHCQMSRLPSIPSYQDWPKTCLFSPKEVLSIAHLEFFSDIYAVKLENESFAQSSNDIDTERGRMVNTPRKRVRRASVLVDISGILTMTSASNVEKLALMQILTFLFVRHKDLLIIATWNATLKLLLEFVASTDPSLQAWSLCALGTFLLMCPEEDHRLEDAFKLLWPTSMQIAAAGGANSDVAFFVLNACVYRPNFMVKVEFGDDIARLFSGRRSETPPFSSYFLREYVTWASNVRKGGPAFGSAMLQDIVLYLMSPNDAEPWRMGQSALQSLSVDICLKLIGIDFMEQRVPGRHILNSLPSNLWPRDDYIREWRMSSSNTFWDAIDSADAEKLEAVMHTSQIKHRLRAPSGVRNEDLVFNVIKSKMEEVLEDISQVQEGPSLLSPKDLVSMKTALFTVSFVTNFARLATLRAESMHTQVANLQVPLLVSKLLLCVVNILASKDLTVENQANFLSVILEFADAETETLEASVDERMTQELPSECSESGYEGTWPLSRSSVEALVDVVSKCLQACSICSSNMRDDIQSPRSAADKSSGQAATVGISHTPSYCPQVETIFGTQMGSQEISYRNYALCIRILTKLQNILWIGACSALQENKRYTLQEFVILSAPSRSYDFPFITDDLVDFVRVSSNVGITPANIQHLFSLCRSLLSEYETEKNSLAWRFVIRSLEVVLPAVRSCPVEDADDMTSEIGGFIQFFIKKVAKRTADWHVCLSFGLLLIQSLKIHSQEKSFDSEQKRNAALTALLELLGHQEIRVRLSIGQQIPALFAIFPAADHSNIFEDILAALQSVNQESQNGCISQAATLASILQSSPSTRTLAMYNLLKITARKSHGEWVRSFLDLVAKRLQFSSGASLVIHMLPEVMWVCDEQDLRAFPFELAGNQSIENFLGANCQFWVPRMIICCKIKRLKHFLQEMTMDVVKVLQKSFAWIMVYILAALNTNSASEHGLPNQSKEDWVAAQAYVVQKLGGDDAFRVEITKAMPLIVVNLLVSLRFKPSMTANSISNGTYSSLPDSVLPCFSVETLSAVLHVLNGYFPTDVADSNLNKSLLRPARLQRILHGFHERLYGELFRNKKRMLLVNGYKHLITLALPSLTHPLLLESICQHLLAAVRDAELCLDACGIFQYLYNNVKGILGEDTTSWLALILPALGQTAIEYARKRNNICQAAVSSLFDDILRSERAAGHEEAVRLAMLQVDDRDGVLTSSTSPYLQVSESTDAKIILAAMDMTGLSSSAQAAKLKYLRRILHSSALTAKIINFPKDLENVVLNLHQILRISEPQDTIAINAAHCVGLLTPLIGFHHSKLTSAGHTANSTESLPSENGHTMVLRYLKHCLFDEDMTRVGIAIRTLRHVLCTRAGISAFDNLDPNVAKYIDLFRGKLLQRPKFMGTSLSYPPLTDKLVWELSADKVAEDGAQQVYYQWLSRLANSLLASYPTDEFYPNLGSMCEVYPHFVETIFSRMVMCALTIETTTYEKTTNSNENSLPLRSLLSTQFTSILKNTKADKRIIHFILNTIEFLREEDYPLGSNPFQNNFWLEIDFQAAAVAAVRISRFASALMYLEIADTTFNFQNRTPGNSLDKVERSPTRSELICTIYKSVDIHDGLEGAIAAIDSDTILAEDGFLIQKYMYEGSWEKVYRLQDARLQTTRRIPDSLQIAEMESTLMQSLSKLGLHHVLQNYALGSRHYETSQFKTDAYAKEVQFECYVRTMQWDLPVDSKLLDNRGFFEDVHVALRALREGQLQVISPTIQLAFGRQLLREKIQDGDNMATSAFSGTSLLTILSEIEELSIVAINGSPDMFQDLIQRWNTRLDAAHLRLGFTEVEPLLALRSSSLACLIDYCQLTDTTTNFQVGVLKAQCEHLLRYSRLARKAGNVQQAFTSNAHLEVLLSSSAAQTVASVRDYFVPLSKLEQSKNNWVDTDKTVAIKSLKYYLRRGTHHEEDALSKPMESTYLTHIGKWVSESRLESPASVLQDYFEPAVQSSALTNDGKLRAKAHYHLARFADAQYQDLLANDLQEEIREHIRYKQSEADACEALAKQNASRDPNIVKRYVHIRDKMLLQIKMDEAEQNRYLKDRTMFLEKAIENYMESLEYGYVQADVAVFRLCALWLANLEVKSVNSIFRTYINRIPTRKFLVLMYQLSARLTNTPHPAELEFQKTLQLLITLVVKDHPHHTLYQIIALKNGTQLGAPSAQKNKSVPQNPTSTSAATVLDRLRRPEALGDLVLRVETLCDAYIDLAWKGITPAMLKTTKTFPLSRRSPIGQIAVQGLDVPVITADHPVRGDCKYDDLPRITGFKNTFTVPGGINVPKVVECYATDGKTYTQLVKGNDDLRQDAVLSKIFSIMNTLLSKDPNTRKRNLSIRTYKVVPLAPRAGLVEWVHNTLPIGEYLTKAHTTYNPNDWRPTQCRTKMSEEMKKGTRQSRLQIYREVERHFNPVFRHFFFEKFLRPKDWLDRKLAYTRSVATSSIAGYIVGLGDRHAQNILIDAKSAEVVHIDLGIAFDQGKLLTVPELVPFRLTRDMVDGMGITGLEGAFRRSCEESLRVFREDAEMLMTILDVFRYDPLYNWKVTPLEQRRRQGDLEELQEGLTSDPAFQKANPAVRGPNKEAERALFVVKKKLSTDSDVSRLAALDVEKDRAVMKGRKFIVNTSDSNSYIGHS